MTKTEKIDQRTRRVADALLSVAKSLESAAKSLEVATNIMIGADTAVKMEKNPDAPKRGLTSYIFYVKQARAGVVRQHPSIRAAEVITILGHQWKALTAEEKQPYIHMAAADKVRYNREMTAYRREKGIPAPRSHKKSAPAPVPAPTPTPTPTPAESSQASIEIKKEPSPSPSPSSSPSSSSPSSQSSESSSSAASEASVESSAASDEGSERFSPAAYVVSVESSPTPVESKKRLAPVNEAVVLIKNKKSKNNKFVPVKTQPEQENNPPKRGKKQSKGNKRQAM